MVRMLTDAVVQSVLWYREANMDRRIYAENAILFDWASYYVVRVEECLSKLEGDQYDQEQRDKRIKQFLITCQVLANA